MGCFRSFDGMRAGAFRASEAYHSILGSGDDPVAGFHLVAASVLNHHGVGVVRRVS